MLRLKGGNQVYCTKQCRLEGRNAASEAGVVADCWEFGRGCAAGSSHHASSKRIPKYRDAWMAIDGVRILAFLSEIAKWALLGHDPWMSNEAQDAPLRFEQNLDG
jgi:hypothetical protein